MMPIHSRSAKLSWRLVPIWTPTAPLAPFIYKKYCLTTCWHWQYIMKCTARLMPGPYAAPHSRRSLVSNGAKSPFIYTVRKEFQHFQYCNRLMMAQKVCIFLLLLMPLVFHLKKLFT
jgi:hypothetical protein